MKTKLKISGIFVVFIAMLLLMGAVSASDESIRLKKMNRHKT